MATPRFVKKFLKQTAVYWGNPVEDGFGGRTFDEPREIKCRWKDNKELRLSEDNREIFQKTDVLVSEALDIQGYLYLGKLKDIEGYYESDGRTMHPIKVPKTYEITGTSETPFLRQNTFLYKVTLGFGNILRTKKQYATRY